MATAHVSNDKRRGLILACTGVTILSCDALMVKLPAGASAWEKVLVRYGVYGAVCFGVCAIEAMRYGAERVRPCTQHWLAGACLAACNLCFVNSLQRCSAAVTLAVLASAPLWSGLAARVLLHEATPAHTLVACALGFGCVIFIVSGQRESSGNSDDELLGALLALGAAFAFALYSVACRAFYKTGAAGADARSSTQREATTDSAPGGVGPGSIHQAAETKQVQERSIMPALAISAVVDVAVALVALLPDIASVKRLSQHDTLWLCFQGVSVLPASFALISMGAKHLLAPEVALVMLAETVLGPVWVFAVLDEVPEASALWGGGLLLLVLVGNAVLTLRAPRNQVDPLA